VKKKYQILIGTHNDGKLRELRYLLSKKLKLLSPKDLNIKSPAENGKTFLENSKLKANYFYKHSKIISISDDSGLSINCLNGKPGIFSARWAKKYGGFHRAMKKIIKMVDKKNKNRNAFFTCSLTIQVSKNKNISSVGKIYGKISKNIKGKNGFGYDSIFIPKGYNITFGQFLKRKKMLMDHRYLAYKKLKKKIIFL
jgi:XTP/dITP diphosphohydrolase